MTTGQRAISMTCQVDCEFLRIRGKFKGNLTHKFIYQSTHRMRRKFPKCKTRDYV